MSEGRVSVRLMAGTPGSGEVSEWLRFIWAMNEGKEGDDRICGAPTFLGPWWAGGEVEEYPDVRVIHRSDPTVSIVSKTERGAKAIRAAAEALDIHIPAY